MNAEEFEKLVQQAVENNIRALLQSQLIVEDGNRYTSRFALKGGGITVNGQPLHIPLYREREKG